MYALHYHLQWTNGATNIYCRIYQHIQLPTHFPPTLFTIYSKYSQNLRVFIHDSETNHLTHPMLIIISPLIKHDAFGNEWKKSSVGK